jgi:hypothetical protein
MAHNRMQHVKITLYVAILFQRTRFLLKELRVTLRLELFGRNDKVHILIFYECFIMQIYCLIYTSSSFYDEERYYSCVFRL